MRTDTFSSPVMKFITQAGEIGVVLQAQGAGDYGDLHRRRRISSIRHPTPGREPRQPNLFRPRVASHHHPLHRRLAEAGIEPSVGSTGDSYDNALAEILIGLLKAELMWRRGRWRTRDRGPCGPIELFEHPES